MFSANLNPLAAFAGGFTTFFASCLLPLVPTYLAYLMGSSTITDEKTGRSKLLKTSLVFVLGFSLTFIIFGLVLNRFAGLLLPYRWWLEKIGGLLFIVFGLQLLLPTTNSFLQREWRLPDISQKMSKWHYTHAFLFGVVFASGWTPCIGPMLAVILLWSAHQETLLQGAILLTSFSAGLGLPFLLTALAFEKVMPWWQRSKKVSSYVRIVAGGLVLINGVLLLTGVWQGMAMKIISYLPISALTF